MNLQQLKHGAFDMLAADNGHIAVTMLPELGGKLLSLRDLRTGHEWLWQSERIALARQPYGVSYIQHADSGGWDECFPTVAPCRYPFGPTTSVILPDHGDVWSQTWVTDVLQTDTTLQISGSCRTVALPCTFTRTLVLSAGQPRLDLFYEARNYSSAPLAFIWSAHPLLRLLPGMRLHFPANARFHRYSATPATELPRARDLRWPFTLRNGVRAIALDPLPGYEAGIAFKIWSEPLSEGWATLQAPQGQLHFRFDVQQIPQIALWLNAGGWSGIGGAPYCNLALEPCIGAQDSLEEAVLEHRQYALLPGGASRHWQLTTELSS